VDIIRPLTAIGPKAFIDVHVATVHRRRWTRGQAEQTVKVLGDGLAIPALALILV
jgi:hypothetical protein